MKPLIRFHSIVLSITTLLIFSMLEIFVALGKEYPYLTILIATISSIGFYRVLVICTKSLVLNIRYFKKIVFGSQYIEGVWIGFFIGQSNNVGFYIETYEQNFDSITIRGKEFREKVGYYSSWISESVNFDDKKGTLNYTYKSDALSHTFINSGFAEFVIERNKNNAPPHRFFGFYANLYNTKKMRSFAKNLKSAADFFAISKQIQS